MNFTRKRSLMSSKLWLLLLTCQLLEEPKECFGVEESNSVEATREKSNEDERRLSRSLDDENSVNSRSCQFFKSSNRLICKGSIDFPYLKTLQKEQITDFIVENYEAESVYKKKYWSKQNLKTGEWYTKLPKVYQKLKGEVQLQDTGVQITVNLRLLPRKDAKGFFIEGEAFSNKVIKISWSLKGNLSLDFIENRTVIAMNVGGNGEWSLQSNLTFVQRNPDENFDDWKVVGFIKSQYVSENEYVIYKGTVGTRMMKGECRFSGQLKVQNVNLIGVVTGNVSPPQNKQISIPRSAFSEMSVRNFVFKDSVFFNDFDKNSFQDLSSVETFAFTGSKLEVMPKLDELLQSFSDLKEIYIEDCITPRLRFGSVAVLKNVQSVSFKGSGPLYFDNISFLWLKNSNLTVLNLENTHITIPLTSISVLWSVNNTLKYLDVSHSTLTDEKDLTSMLRSLSITDLKAEVLQLKKIPTNALHQVRNTLQRLSFKGNDFKKVLQKHIFDSVFNFPLMPELRELNLVDCHINYLEKGAFDNLPNLKVLHMAYNNLENAQDGWAVLKPQITHLDLSHNGLTPSLPSIGLYDIGTVMNLSVLEKLEVLDLTDGIFTNPPKIIASLGSNLRNLSLRNTNLEDLPDNIFQNLHQLEILDMSYNRNIKTIQSFSFGLFRNLKNLKSLNLKRCRISSSDIFNNHQLESRESENYTLDSLQVLDLSCNNIKILDFETFQMFPKLKILNLSGNSITVWRKSLLGFSKYLRAVFLDENKIETLTADMLSDLRKLKYVKLGNNPFICGSYVYEFLKMINAGPAGSVFSNEPRMEGTNDFLKTSGKRSFSILRNIFHHIKEKRESYVLNEDTVKVVDWSEDSYVCFSWSQAKFVPFSRVRETFDDLPHKNLEKNKVALLWLSVVAVAGIVVTVAIICWKCLDVHLITRAVRNAVALSFLGRGENEPAKYEYNVFVSYSDKDRSWVVENLLPRLESWSDVKVCMHERDFQVGLSILENVIASIDNSKNIILVLSEAFLKSQWCQYEMHLAQHRLLEKGRDQLILILLENIPLVKRPKTLRYLMMTKTYIQWPVRPKSSSETEVFWNRLMKSLSRLN